MTFTEYLQYKAPDGMRDELIDGEIKLSPSPTARHQGVCKQLERLLDQAIDQKVWTAQRDTTLFIDNREGPRPDVFVIRKDRWQEAIDSGIGYPTGTPELVIEVRSESNTDAEFAKKEEAYFSDERCLAFWIVDPAKQQIRVLYRGGASPFIIDNQHRVMLPFEIAATSLAVNKIFA